MITPDGKTLASGSGRWDHTWLWSLPDGCIIHRFSRDDGGVTALALTPDGRTLAAPNGRKVKIYSFPDGNLVRAFGGHADQIRAVAISPDGKTLVSGSWDKTIQVWLLPDGSRAEKLVWTLNGHIGHVDALVVAPDGKTLVSGDDKGVVILWDLATGKPVRYLFDPEVSMTDAYVYSTVDKTTGQTLTYTLPCGSPVPDGATCVCNCVAGKYRPPGPSQPPGVSVCTCNKICTCIPVCQAHRVLHPDSVVRTLAEELLLVMGRRERAYMAWAAGRAPAALRSRIEQIVAAIANGAAPDPSRWPSPAACAPYLRAEDEVVGVMAAQMIRLHEAATGRPSAPGRDVRVDEMLERARRRPWFTRGAVESIRAGE